MALWTAFILGLAGSWHCVGMCGPIALALSGNGNLSSRYITGRALYNIGRVATYFILGIIFGLFGKSMMLAGLQQAVSITLGALLLLAAFSIWQPEKLLSQSWFFGRFLSWLKQKLGSYIKRGGNTASLVTGLLNGLLPCGLVYAALAGAVSTAGLFSGGLYMAAFGIGTFPTMLAISIFGNQLSLKTRSLFNKAIPFTLAIFACLLILRGLNLGIPFLSPMLSASGSCH